MSFCFEIESSEGLSRFSRVSFVLFLRFPVISGWRWDRIFVSFELPIPTEQPRYWWQSFTTASVLMTSNYDIRKRCARMFIFFSFFLSFFLFIVLVFSFAFFVSFVSFRISPSNLSPHESLNLKGKGEATVLECHSTTESLQCYSTVMVDQRAYSATAELKLKYHSTVMVYRSLQCYSTVMVYRRRYSCYRSYNAVMVSQSLKYDGTVMV